MDRNTILAIVLSVIVISVGMTLQTLFIEPQPVAEGTTMEAEEAIVQEGISPSYSGISAVGDVTDTSRFPVTTENFEITFDPIGGTIASIKTLKHLENGSPVELLFKDADDPNAMMLYSGAGDDNAIDDAFTTRDAPGDPFQFQH